MKYLIFLLTLTISCTLTNKLVGQRTDSTFSVGGITGDTLYIIHENIPKSKFWGNSWYSSASYNLSKSHEFTLNFGRTFGNVFTGGGGTYINLKSWGVGYSYLIDGDGDGDGQTINGFFEFTFFPIPPAAARIDYLYDFINGNQYVRPSVGISFLGFDILYNYSFLINGNENHFKNGVIFRLKYFINNKNWQKNYPRHC